jgi:hypothetical protein
MKNLWDYIELYGIPRSLCVDRDAVFITDQRTNDPGRTTGGEAINAIWTCLTATRDQDYIRTLTSGKGSGRAKERGISGPIGKGTTIVKSRLGVKSLFLTIDLLSNSIVKYRY